MRRARELVFCAALAMAGSPARAQNSTISSLTGPVTSSEISSFKAVLPGLTPGESNTGNHYAYGNGGDAMESLGDMYDVSKDLVILDKLIQYCDKVVSIRNTTRAFWNGNRDPVWPNSTTGTTWGAEQGDVAGHLAYAAQRISENPSIWDRAVGIGDPRGYGRTYRERALRYLAVTRETLNLFYLYFIRSDETMFFPSDASWPDANTKSDPVPWNQQAMITSGMIRGAYAYERFGVATGDIAKWRATTRASVTRFFNQCRNFQYTRNGKTYYKWSYSGGTFAPGAPIQYTEDTGHAGYDIALAWRPYNLLGGAAPSATDMRILADTLMDIIRSGSQWWGKVDGTGTMRASIGNTFTYLSQFRSDVYGATVKTGSQYYADAGRKLWIKQARHVGWGPSVGGTSPTPTPSPTPTLPPRVTPAPGGEITPSGSAVTASTNDGNVPSNAVDNNLTTRWSASGDNQWLRFDLGATRTVGSVRIATYQGNTRRTRFDLQVSSDGSAWTNVLTGIETSGTTTAEEPFDFSDASARYVRYMGHGNSTNMWNSVSELSIFGQ